MLVDAPGARHAHEGDEHEEGHATASEAREILPWIRLSATLDPNRVESYVTAAYWLRERLDRPVEAEQFLREGLKNNPESHEILFELGRIAHESKHNNRLARVMWERSLAMWMKNESTREEPDLFFLRQIVTYLGHMEAEDGDYARALEVFEIGATVGRRPDLYQDDIAAVRTKLAARNADQTSR